MKVYKELKSCKDLNCGNYTYGYDSADTFDMDVTYYCTHPDLRNYSSEIRRLGPEPNFCDKCPIIKQMLNKGFDDDKLGIILM